MSKVYLKYYAVLVFAFFSIANCKAQSIIDFYQKQTDSIVIPKIEDNKVNIFIFIDQGDDTTLGKKLLLSQLNSANIDYINFNIYRFFLTPLLACPPKNSKEILIMLDGYSELSHPFPINPFYIIVKTDNSKYDSLVNLRLDSKLKKAINIVGNNRNKPSPFNRIKSINTLIKFISLTNANNLQTSTDKNEIQRLSEDLRIQKSKTDQYFRYTDSIRTRKRLNVLSIHYLPPILNQVSENGFKASSIKMNKTTISSLEINYNRYFSKFDGFGWALGIGYTEFEGTLGINNTNNLIVDTIGRNLKDAHGGNYTRIAYGKNIKENIHINYASITALIGYKKSFDKGYCSFNTGIKYSNILNSSYNATAGDMSWKGYYHKGFIMDSGYDYYQNQPVFKGSKHLELKQAFVSGLITFDFGFNPVPKVKTLFFSCVFFGEIGTNIIKSNKDESLLPFTTGNYNSFVYRADKFQINTWGLKYGFSYAF